MDCAALHAPPMEHSIDQHVFDDLQATLGAAFVADLVETYAAETLALITQLRYLLKGGEAESFRRVARSVHLNAHSLGAARMATLARNLEIAGSASEIGSVNTLALEFDAGLTTLRALVLSSPRLGP